MLKQCITLFLKISKKILIILAVELERLESEKKEIHDEYEQERIAYQKLLKEYNRLELQRDNLQV